MMNLKHSNKKESFIFYFKRIFLFVICALFFGMGAYAESSVDTPETRQITLPSKIEGVQKLEYVMDKKNMGSTAGTKSINAAPETVLNFLIQIEPENYSKLRVKDVKIKSQTGQTLNLMKYMYNKNGEFTKVSISENDFIDPKQTYITSDYRVYYDDTLSFSNELKKDSFNANISIDSNNYPINEALDISYKLGKDDQTKTPSYNKPENRFEINNILVNTPITLTINKNKEFSQSEIEIFNGENKLSVSDKGTITIPGIKSDLNIKIKNVNKNKYNLSFKKYEDVSFECKKSGESGNFEPISGKTLNITSGESYDFKCNAPSENTLAGKEITSNGIAIQSNGGIYSLQNIEEDTAIDISSKEESSYKINLPKEGSGVTLTNESEEKITSANARFGENFKFKIKAEKGYENSIIDALVYAVPADKLENNDYNAEKNPEEAKKYLLTPSNGNVYTVSEIKEPVSIIVKNLVKDTYKLKFSEKTNGVSYKVETSESVKEISPNMFTATYGSKIFVTLTPEEGKTLNSQALVSNDPNTLITKNGNIYTIENITDDTNFIITPAEEKRCNVTFDSEGIICKDEKGNALGYNALTVDYKGSAKFKVALTEGYKADNGINLEIKSGSATLSKLSEENFFEISNVTNDTIISAKGIEKEKITVKLGSTGDGSVVFKSDTNENLPIENNINFGSDLEFEVSSPNNSDQTYNVTSSNEGANIQLIDSASNRFALRGARSDTTLVATPVYSSNNNLGGTLGNTNDSNSQARSQTNPDTVEVPIIKELQFLTNNNNTAQMENTGINCFFTKENGDMGHYETHIPIMSKPSSTINLTSIKTNFIKSSEDDNQYESGIELNFRISAYHPQKELVVSQLEKYIKTDGSSSASLIEPFNSFTKKSFKIQGDERVFEVEPYDIDPESGYNVYYSQGVNNKHADITMKIKFKGHFKDQSEADPSQDMQQTDYYFDKMVVNYECENYVDSNITFIPPENNAAYFEDYYGRSFPENKTSITKKNSMLFKLNAGESKYFEFADDAECKNAISIDSGEAGCAYDLEVKGKNDSQVIYEIKNIKNNNEPQPVNLNISVNENYLKDKKFKGIFKGDRASCEDEDELPISSKTFDYNGSLTFYTKPDETADPSKIKYLKFNVNNAVYDCDVNSEEIQDIANNKLKVQLEKENERLKVTLSQIKTDFTVTAGYERKDVKIKFNADTNFRYKCWSPASLATIDDGIIPVKPDQELDTKDIKYGQSLSFTISAGEGVNIENIEVTSNGHTIDLVNGKYTIPSITENQDIRVRGISAATNNVTFTRYDDVFFKNLNNETYGEQTPVEYNGEITFKLATSAAYTGSADKIKVWAEYASGAKKEFKSTDEYTIKNDNNSYTLKGIKEDVRIYLENMSLNKYKVELKPIEGIEYYNQYGTEKLGSNLQSVTHGDSFSFKVKAKTGYDISNLKVYDKPESSGNATQLLSSHDVYTINNVTENHIITAQNAPKSKCKIEFRSLEGSSYTDASGNTIDNNIEVDYGSDYKFKLSLDTAYNKSKPIVNIKGVSKPLQRNSDGSYTIPNVKEDRIIEVTNVTKNTYTATFVDTEGVIYRTAKNKPFTGTQPVEYEGTLYFKISLMDAYDKSTPLVLLDNKKVLGENSGVYSISNIHDDVVVTVKNVVKNPEEVSISDILNVPTEINTEGDVDAVVRATRTYMNLSEEEKEQVTNIDDLKKAQENAGRLNHFTDDVEIAGVDWNIKLIVTPLTGDSEQMRSFEEKVDRRSLFSLYEIHLVDLLSGKNYEVPYGQKVSVILPAPDLTGCTNAVVAHETSAGSMEYLDISIVDNRAQFETSSFSKFGIAAKRLENYVENPSDMRISVNSLVDNEEELKSLLGEGLVSQLGSLIDKDNNEETPKKEENTDNSDSIVNGNSLADVFGLKKVFNDAGLEKSYNWFLENELISVIGILIIGGLLIWLLLALARKKKKEEKKTKKK